MHRRAVTTIIWVTPCNDRSICQDRSKCTICGLNLLHIPELILDRRAVTATIWPAPGNDPVAPTATAPHGKCFLRCRHLCLLHNGCQVISLLEYSTLEGLVWISQDVPLCSDKPEEALFKRLLRQTFQVPSFGGLCNGQAFPFSTRQSYVNLQH